MNKTAKILFSENIDTNMIFIKEACNNIEERLEAIKECIIRKKLGKSITNSTMNDISGLECVLNQTIVNNTTVKSIKDKCIKNLNTLKKNQTWGANNIDD